MGISLKKKEEEEARVRLKAKCKFQTEKMGGNTKNNIIFELIFKFHFSVTGALNGGLGVVFLKSGLVDPSKSRIEFFDYFSIFTI